MEAAIIKAARDYGVTPWAYAEECTQDWWAWQLAYWQAEAQVSRQQINEMKRRGM